MRNTPLKAFAKSALKHSEKSHKAEHTEKGKQYQKEQTAGGSRDMVYKPDHQEANQHGYVPASLVKD